MFIVHAVVLFLFKLNHKPYYVILNITITSFCILSICCFMKTLVFLFFFHFIICNSFSVYILISLVNVFLSVIVSCCDSFGLKEELMSIIHSFMRKELLYIQLFVLLTRNFHFIIHVFRMK